MAIQVLSDINHNGNKISNPTLEAAKFGAAPGAPEAGHFYNKNGVLYYRNTSNVEVPVHENALRTISAAAGSPVTATVIGTTAEIAIAPASATNPGMLSSEQYALLSGATSAATPGSLVIRGAESGNEGDPVGTNFGSVFATNINASGSINSLSMSSGEIYATNVQVIAVPYGSSATSKDYVTNAITTATNALKTGVSEVNGVGAITASTDSAGVVNVSASLATATTPGTLSAQQFAMLTGATELNVPGTVVLRGAGGSGGQTAFDSINVVELTASNNILSSFIGATTINGQDISANNIIVNVALTTPEVTGLSATPAGNSSATSKGYVDTLVQNSLRDAVAGLDAKDGVRVAVDTNTALTSVFGTFGGVAIAASDTNKSILLINQTNSTENGAWLVSASGLTRRKDSDTVANLTTGAFYPVEDGTYKQNVFSMITPNGYVMGTDAIVFLNISGVNTIVAADGLTRNGQTINVGGTTDRIRVLADSIDIAPAFDLSIESRIATAIAPLLDQTETQALIDLSLVPLTQGGQKEVFFRVGDGTSLSFDLTHNLISSRPSVTGFYNGQPLGAIDFQVLGTGAIRVFASLGGSPLAVDSLEIVVKAEYSAYVEFLTPAGAIQGNGGN